MSVYRKLFKLRLEGINKLISYKDKDDEKIPDKIPSGYELIRSEDWPLLISKQDLKDYEDLFPLQEDAPDMSFIVRLPFEEDRKNPSKAQKDGVKWLDYYFVCNIYNDIDRSDLVVEKIVDAESGKTYRASRTDIGEDNMPDEISDILADQVKWWVKKENVVDFDYDPGGFDDPGPYWGPRR